MKVTLALVARNIRQEISRRINKKRGHRICIVIRFTWRTARNTGTVRCRGRWNSSKDYTEDTSTSFPSKTQQWTKHNKHNLVNWFKSTSVHPTPTTSLSKPWVRRLIASVLYSSKRSGRCLIESSISWYSWILLKKFRNCFILLW